MFILNKSKEFKFEEEIDFVSTDRVSNAELQFKLLVAKKEVLSDILYDCSVGLRNLTKKK